MAVDNFFVSEQHPISRRTAVLEGSNSSIWLYLTESDTLRPVADVWVYNRIPAPPKAEIAAYRGKPPPAAQEYTRASAMCEYPHTHKWSFIWSSDGEAVAVIVDSFATAFACAAQKRGYSRELVANSPWGNPWSDQMYLLKFDNQPS